jgi:hypothetical protein
MAFNSNNLSALAYANGFTLWPYKTPDLAANIDTAGYFNNAAAMLRVGDFIMANVNINAAIQSGVFIVKTNTGSVVNVANLADLGALDGD